jgi:hypothetical protein
VRHGDKSPHKIREFAKIALYILAGSVGASWLLGQVKPPSEMRVVIRAPKVNRVLLGFIATQQEEVT